MKLFDVVWATVLRDLPRWTALPAAARQALLVELKTHGYVPEERFGRSLDVILASGIAVRHRNRPVVSAAEEHRELLKVLRAMHRHPVFDDPDPRALLEYLEEHFTSGEIDAIGRGTVDRFGHITRAAVAGRAASAEWPGDLIAASGGKELSAWAAARGLHVPPGGPPLVRELQALARRLLPAPHGVPLAEVVAAAGDEGLPALAAALHAGLHTITVFAAMRGADLEPMIGLWPAAVGELTRPPARRPSPVVPAERFELAVQMEDMTTVVAAVLAAPLRLRADDLAVFARTKVQLEARLVSLPPWAAHLLTDTRSHRVDAAARELRRLGLARVADRQGMPHLQATADAALWLARPAHDRLASLLDPIRASREVNPVGTYEAVPAAPFFPYSFPYLRAPASLDLRAAMTRAFLEAGEGFVAAEAFVEHAAEQENPLLEMLARTKKHDLDALLFHTYGADPRQSYRVLWRNAVTSFLAVRLLGLGGAAAGVLADGTLCFALTDVGRYLLGAADRFTYGGGGTADVVVQPNFDVVFLGAAPATEALLARYAERVGAAPGLAFRITRASVMAAAESGATAGDVLGAFREASSKPLPKNVEREIAGWLAAVRRARLRVVRVVECADAETADRAGALLGTKARRLTPTMLELAEETASAHAATLKRLRAGGVFLDGDTIAPARPRRNTLSRTGY